MVDDELQVVTTDTGSMIQFQAVNSSINSSFSTQISGVSKFFSTYGVFKVSGMGLSSDPNSTQKLILSVSDDGGINFKHNPSVKAYLNSVFEP